MIKIQFYLLENMHEYDKKKKKPLRFGYVHGKKNIFVFFK
jgi:hypothetical protein